jgi:elongation factor Tu
VPLNPLAPLPEPKPKSNKPELSIFSFGESLTPRLTLLLGFQNKYSQRPTLDLEALLAQDQTSLELEHHSESKSFSHRAPRDTASQNLEVMRSYDGAIWVTDGAPTTEQLFLLQILRRMSASLLIFLLDESNPKNQHHEERRRREEQLDLDEMTLREHCDDAGYEGDLVEIVRGDPLQDVSIQAMYEACDRVFFPTREKKDSFLMHIEDVFIVRNDRVIVTGRPDRGMAQTGDKLEVFGKRPTRAVAITAIESFRRTKDVAVAGINIGIMLGGVARGEVERGQVLAETGSMQAQDHFEAAAYFYPPESGPTYPPLIGQKFQIILFLQNTECVLTEGEFVSGGLSFVRIKTAESVAIEEFARFQIVAENRSAGVGLVLSLAR